MMDFQEPMVRFVRIDKQFVTDQSTCEGTGQPSSCVDVLLSDYDICDCYPSGSGVVTQINNKFINSQATSGKKTSSSDSGDHNFFNGFISFDK